MKLQILSDLHLESEAFDPQPAPGAELLVLAGDIDSTWAGLQRFAGWPVPVLMVAGNHEFDGRDLAAAWGPLRETCERAGIRLLQREELLMRDGAGRAVRFLGATRWSDFDLFGEKGRPKAERAAGYYLKKMGSTLEGRPLDTAALRAEGQACRAWLEQALGLRAAEPVQATVVITHFAPSLRSADPRYGRQPGTASFCNADDDLMPRADLWIHGHLHCRHDYRVDRPGRAPARVVCQARGLVRKGESAGFDPGRLFEV
ncbi:MAG: metallophosphoesterase [Rubrivivax sp.]